MRESPALEVIELLREKGAKISYNDPYIPRIPKVRKHDLDLKSTPLTAKFLKSVDAALIITDHSSYDYSWIVENSDLVVDTRNATKDVKKFRSRILKA